MLLLRDIDRAVLHRESVWIKRDQTQTLPVQEYFRVIGHLPVASRQAVFVEMARHSYFETRYLASPSRRRRERRNSALKWNLLQRAAVINSIFLLQRLYHRCVGFPPVG